MRKSTTHTPLFLLSLRSISVAALLESTPPLPLVPALTAAPASTVGPPLLPVRSAQLELMLAANRHRNAPFVPVSKNFSFNQSHILYAHPCHPPSPQRQQPENIMRTKPRMRLTTHRARHAARARNLGTAVPTPSARSTMPPTTARHAV